MPATEVETRLARLAPLTDRSRPEMFVAQMADMVRQAQAAIDSGIDPDPFLTQAETAAGLRRPDRPGVVDELHECGRCQEWIQPVPGAKRWKNGAVAYRTACVYCRAKFTGNQHAAGVVLSAHNRPAVTLLFNSGPQ